MQNASRMFAFLGASLFSALASSLIWIPLTIAASAPAAAQSKEGPAVAAAPVVPQQVRYAGKLTARTGEIVEAGFRIYAAAEGGDPLWTETQRVTVGEDGSYSVLLGGASPAGLPQTVFAGGAARWLGVSVERSAEQERVLLSSVPYAMKSADAESLAGHAASDFVTQEQLAQLAQSSVPSGQKGAASPDVQSDTSGTVTGSGTDGTIPLWTGALTQGNSEITQFNSYIGVNEATPQATLDVGGTEIVEGALTLPPLATATKTTPQRSQLIQFNSSTWSSTTNAPVTSTFKLLSEPLNNNSANATSDLELHFQPSATGGSSTVLSISNNGVINFASAQTFPGTIKSVAATSPVTATTTSGAVSLGMNTSALETTLNTVYPQLGATNTFTKPITFASGQTFPGPVSTTGTVNAGSFDLGGSLFAYGNQNGNSFLGFAGSGSVPSSIDNTAVGYEAMTALTGGGSNTAVGANALDTITTGNLNTALGAYSGAGYSNLIDSTAIGANAIVSQNDSLVLGQTTDGSPGKTYVNVGVGTSVPASELELSKSASDALGPVLTLTNPAGDGASAAIDFKTYLHPSTATSPTARIWALDDNYGTDLLFLSKEPGSDFNPLQTNMAIFANGQVTIGTLSQLTVYEGQTRDAQLSVQGSIGLNGIVAVGGAPASGFSDGGNGGIFGGGNDADGVWGISGGGLGGFFQGDVFVNGTLQASTKNFKIDHPSDPANKYLVHSSVESSEMMNIYSGNVVTDKLGLATVTLPEWFEVENGDFRYQLTTIGRDAHAWIAEEVANNRFKIATNATFVKVSWQIIAVRQDAYAKAHPLIVEQEKPANERGYYIHPELYGQPEEKQIAWARNPKVMQQIKVRREAEMKARTQAKK